MTRPMPGPPECTCIGRGSGCLTCLDAIGYDLEATCPGCPVHAGPSYLETKRLTDAECDAEYWRASFDCEDYSLSDGYGDGIVEPISRARWWMRDPINNDQRKATWHRFATYPHALEES